MKKLHPRRVALYSPDMDFPAHLDWLKSDPLARLRDAKREGVAQGRDVIDLSMINPDILPSTYILDKLHEFSIKPYHHRYSVSRGLQKLREAFVNKYRRIASVELNPDTEVCVSMGTKDAIHSILTSVGDAGDTVLLGRPAYPMYVSATRLARMRADFFEISDDEELMKRGIVSAIERLRPKVLLLNFPNNPTGLCVSQEFLACVIQTARAANTLVVNDFVYGEMGFDQAPVSALSAAGGAPDGVLETYSLSKAYCVPGWRIGAILGDSQVISEIARVKAHSDYGVFIPIQLASAAVLTARHDLVSPVARQYRARARGFTRGLQSLGFVIQSPGAGASLWIRGGRSGGPDSFAMAEEIFRETGVLFMPGAMYGRPYDAWLRAALVVSEERLHEVVERLGESRCVRDVLASERQGVTAHARHG